MRKTVFITATAALAVGLASCTGSAGSNEAAQADSTAATVETAAPVDTAAVRAEADSIIRATLSDYYKKEKKNVSTDTLAEGVFTPGFIAEFDSLKTETTARAKRETPSMHGLFPIIATVPFDILYEGVEEPSPDGMRNPVRGKYEIADVTFDGLDKAVATVRTTLVMEDYIPEEDRTSKEYVKATIEMVMVNVDGQWLVDDIRHRKTGSFRDRLRSKKGIDIIWTT